MSVFDGCLQQILFPWNALVCCSVCSQWLLLTLTWFDNSSENGVRIRCAPDCMDDWQRSLQLFRQMLWLWNLRDSKFEQSLELLSQFSVDKVNASILDGPSVSFSQRNRWISDSKDDRLICAPICTVSQVHFELQGVASGISYLVSRGALLWIDIHPHVSDIQGPVAMLATIREMSIWVSITRSQSSAASLISSTLRSFWRFSPIVGCRFLCLVPGKRQWVKLFPCPACWFPWDGPWPWGCWSLAICWVWMVGYVWMVVEIVRFLSMWASLMNWESICHLNPHEIKFQVEAVSMETMTHNAVITACELPSCKTDVKRRPRLCVAAWQRSPRAQNTDQRCVGIISMAGAGKSTCRKTRSNPQKVKLLRCRAVDSTSDCDSAGKGIKFITLQPLSFVSVYIIYLIYIYISG